MRLTKELCNLDAGSVNTLRKTSSMFEISLSQKVARWRKVSEISDFSLRGGEDLDDDGAHAVDDELDADDADDQSHDLRQDVHARAPDQP